MVRPPCCEKMNMKKGLWTPEEDAKILAYVSKHGTGNWTAVPKKAGLRRCGKSCRLRWTNYLRPDLKHDNFTSEEEELIVKLHATIGSRWSIIAQQLPGRTDNDVKNYWNTKLRKKLSDMGIDPVTHKPFSQILADYGNIGGLSKSGTRIGSLGRDLKNAINSKPEQINPFPTPKMEPLMSQECNDHSLALLDQLQAIKLVTEVSRCSNYETIQQHSSHDALFPSQSPSLSSPSSSSSSICSTAAQEKSLTSFSWRDFLLDDALLPTDQEEQEQTQNVLRVQSQSNSTKAGGPEVASSSERSFIEGILDQENDMFFDFPNLSEEPFYY